MCGIAGYIGDYNPKKTLNNMISSLNHRGPDDSGLWYDNKIGLAHTRLSILDTSQSGHQPMISASGRYVIVFNGEIYNHLCLRDELDKESKNNWRGTSDTETLLKCFEEWGTEKTLKKIMGMYAFGIYDRKLEKIILVRDRIGEKPLYYGWVEGNFVFASELKSFKILGNFSNEINKNSVSLFLRFNSIPAPHTIYKDIFKVEPGYYLEISINTLETSFYPYWTLEDTYKNANSFEGTASECVDELESILETAVSSQMISDVPIGAFLSGGVDSSLIVSLMQAASNKRVQTFSIGFDNEDFNEAHHARKVAEVIGTDHNEIYVTEQDAINVIPSLSEIYDEPFADSSQIPTYLVSKLARSKVTVALSGDGGDELFGGYNRYTITNNLFKKINIFPKSIRKTISKGLLQFSEPTWDLFFKKLYSKNYANIGFKIHKGANALSYDSLQDLHYRLASTIDNPSNWLLVCDEPKTILNNDNDKFNQLDDIEKMMAYDILTFLPTDILTKVDRAAMHNSLETRVPFLDLNVVNFAASMPLTYKIRGGEGKWALRKILYKYIPKDIIERPKMGFGVPLDDWLKGPLKDWSENLLDHNALIEDNIFDAGFLNNIWQDHLHGKQNHGHQLWNVLMFQEWLRKNV